MARQILCEKLNAEFSNSATNVTTTSPTHTSKLAAFFKDKNTTTFKSPIDIELQLYYSLPEMPKHDMTSDEYQQENPLIWWQKYATTLPMLSKIARIYIGIPATSVPAERLFSDAGNTITNKRNRLDPNVVHDFLFLKYNFNIVKSSNI